MRTDYRLGLVAVLFVVTSCGPAATGGGSGGASATGGATATGGAASGGRGTGGSATGGSATGGSATGGSGSGGTSTGGSGTGGGSGGGAGLSGTGGAAGRGGTSGAAGGATATGGAASGGRGTGGSGTGGVGGGNVGTGGAGGIKLGTGGPFPFPQGRRSGMCTLATATTASQSVQTAYDAWKTEFVSSNGAGSTAATPSLRVVRTTDNNDTVSEGIGYGMLAAAYMADRATFDGLWNYAKAHLDAKGLMNWQINSSGAVIGQGSATDADEDIAWALLMASNQWSSATYLADARAQITAMLTNEVAADGMLKPGDAWGATNVTFPDYFSPAYFRGFAAATGNARWTGDIMDRNYAILMAVEGTKGLVPDRTTSTYQNMGNYSYDACRTPWRIAMDYCFNGEPRAKAYLDKIGPFFDGIGAANIGDGYSLTGTQTSSNKNMAFIGPAGVAGMAGWPTLLDGAFTFGAMNLGDAKYYPQSLKIITMLMMSGNFLDYTRL